MSKYINADALIESLMVSPDECPGCPEPEFLPELIKILKEAPAADVVEVIRCKDCKYSEQDDILNPHTYLCKNIKTLYEDYFPHHENHYCGYGEREKA